MSILTETLLHKYNLAYILLDTQLHMLEYGGAMWSDINEEAELTELVPELTGCEDILQSILDQDIPDFEMEDINRYKNDEVIYLTIHIALYQPQDGTVQLLITLQDMSRYARTQQTLTQQRNELFLLKQSLDDTNQRLEYIMQRYVPHEVGKALMENRLMPSLGGETLEISTLFVDLRDYTRISEDQMPEETIEMLHVFMDITCTAIIDAGGVVVNYMGDAVMAVFNAPNPQPDHASRAVQAGVGMQLRGTENTHNRWGFHFGVGINTGSALIGNIGTQQHYQYTAVGDAVNTASRLCSHARPREILIGAETYRQMDDDCKNKAQALPAMTFKGKSKPLAVYSLNC